MPRDKRYRSDIPTNAIEQVTKRHDNGSKESTEYFVDGESVGSRYWDDEEILCREIPCKNGIRHGKEYFWDFDGILDSVEPWFEDKPHGTARQWSPSGKLMGTYRMQHGTGIDLWWHQIDCTADGYDGPFYLSEVYYQRDGRPHGCRWLLNEDHTIFSEHHYYNSQPHGIEREWNNHNRMRRSFPRYWVNGTKVDKRRYLRAASNDETPPPYRESDNDPYRDFPEEIRPHLLKK